MPRVASIELIQQIKQPILVISACTKVENLPMLIGQSYGKIVAYLEELNERMTNIPFVAYHSMDMQNLDVEIGFPVAKSFPNKGDIKSAFIPESKAVLSMHRGPYNDMEPIYAEMAKWIENNGYQSTGTSYEYYYNGPEFPVSELLTKIILPIK